MEIHVVIPVFNRRVYTEKCLTQLHEQTWKGLNIIVVDDGSTDGTAEMIQDKFPDVRVIKKDGSLYWTASVYIGVESVLEACAEDDYVLVLNDDLIFDSTFVETLAETAQEHSDALVHAMNAYEHSPDVIDFGGLHINWWTAKYNWINRGHKRCEFPKGHCEESSVLWGRGLLIPSRVFREVGNYDQRIVHRGDPELPRRAAKAGYKLLVAYDVVAYMYKEETPNINERRSYALTEIGEYFFGVLSQGRIRILYWNAMLMTTNRFQGYVYFFCYFTRHLYFFLKHGRRI